MFFQLCILCWSAFYCLTVSNKFKTSRIERYNCILSLWLWGLLPTPLIKFQVDIDSTVSSKRHFQHGCDETSIADVMT